MYFESKIAEANAMLLHLAQLNTIKHIQEVNALIVTILPSMKSFIDDKALYYDLLQTPVNEAKELLRFFALINNVSEAIFPFLSNEEHPYQAFIEVTKIYFSKLKSVENILQSIANETIINQEDELNFAIEYGNLIEQKQTMNKAYTSLRHGIKL